MHRRTTAHLVASLFSLAAFAGACASSSPPPDPGPPPVPTTDAPPAATSTAVATATSTASAQPTYDPVMTGASAATAAPTATAAASASAAPAASAAPTASAASGPAGANLRVGSMTVDGLTIEDLACRADGLGVLGSMLVAGGIAKKKAALVACAPGGDKPRVDWMSTKGKAFVTTVKASTPAVEACVKKALTGTPAPFEGECSATLVLGK